MKSRRTHFTAGNTRPARARVAFTRVELCACLAAGALLVLFTLPALATSQSRGQVAQCLNNLRQMGRAVQMWASDFEGQTPWRTPVANGGLLPAAGSLRAALAWSEYLFLSNQLSTPRILACPAERGKLIASDFSELALNPLFRNNAVSYLLNLETFVDDPQGLLFGDRNVQLTSAFNCSARVNNTLGFYLPTVANQGWTNAVHGLRGDIVLMDGSVSEASSDQLRAAMAQSRNDNGQYVHLLRPQ